MAPEGIELNGPERKTTDGMPGTAAEPARAVQVFGDSVGDYLQPFVQWFMGHPEHSRLEFATLWGVACGGKTRWRLRSDDRPMRALQQALPPR